MVGLFSKPKRVRMAKFVPPAPRPAPPLETQVDEGVLIAATGLRMALKNQAIMWALRDGDDFDHERYLSTARRLVLEASEEANLDADRIDLDDRDTDDSELLYARSIDPDRRERRRRVLWGVSDRLTEMADDEAFLARLALEARDAAWHEIGTAVTASALRFSSTATHATGEDRDRQLANVRFDLEEMERERGSY